MEELIWEIFKKTGDIKYYLLVKKLGEEDANEKNRRNSNK